MVPASECQGEAKISLFTSREKWADRFVGNASSELRNTMWVWRFCRQTYERSIYSWFNIWSTSCQVDRERTQALRFTDTSSLEGSSQNGQIFWSNHLYQPLNENRQRKPWKRQLIGVVASFPCTQFFPTGKQSYINENSVIYPSWSQGGWILFIFMAIKNAKK